MPLPLAPILGFPMYRRIGPDHGPIADPIWPEVLQKTLVQGETQLNQAHS